MKQFHTSIVEFRRPYEGDVTTYPYEAGWADEAIFFVTAEPATPSTSTVSVAVQVSADGIRWIDEGARLELTGPSEGFVRVSHFGGFLRLAGTVTGNRDARCTLTVRLALKG